MQAKPFDLGGGLELRAASRGDTNALIELVRHNVAHLGRYLPPVAEILTAEAAAAHFDLADRQIADRKLIDWHVFQDGVMCGEIRLNYIEEGNRKSAVAYFTRRAFSGPRHHQSCTGEGAGTCLHRSGVQPHRIALHRDQYAQPSRGRARRLCSRRAVAAGGISGRSLPRRPCLQPACQRVQATHRRVNAKSNNVRMALILTPSTPRSASQCP